MRRNVFKAISSWRDLCQLSLGLTNSHKEDGLEGPYVWMANNSFGGRGWEAGKAVKAIDSGFNGEWLAFGEETAKQFLWVSRTSEASIEAVRHGDEWRLSYCGPDLDKEGRESGYLNLFLGAAQVITSIEEMGGYDFIEVAVNRILQSDYHIKNYPNFLENVVASLATINLIRKAAKDSRQRRKEEAEEAAWNFQDQYNGRQSRRRF